MYKNGVVLLYTNMLLNHAKISVLIELKLGTHSLKSGFNIGPF